ncbi:MAG TPA: TIGR00366 family protein [Syntrophobacteraceae bacterium]|nr:TIGR00366 family protein [Syntrophobacteraceae bacterium]
MSKDSEVQVESALEKFGLGLAAWSEKWFPEAWVFALLGIVFVFFFGILIGESPVNLALAGGKQFWVLIPFTMQMAMIIIGGYVVASTPAVYWIIRKVALIPKNGKTAVAWIALFSTATSLISWGLSLIFSGLLVREMSRRLDDMDYRAAGAAGYLGLGAVWALGLSSSAALMMATKNAIPPKLFEISGLIPLTQTLFIRANLWTILALIVVSILIAYFSAPNPSRAKNAKAFGLSFDQLDMSVEARQKPGEWLEYSPLLILIVGAILVYYLIDVFRTSPSGALAALDLNTYNMIFITVGMILHWRPKRFLKSVAQAVPATGGVLIQFPFYAVIFGMIVGTSVNTWLADLFYKVTTHGTYPLLVAAYSAVLGVFIPSGGSKWVVEAPYVLQAASMHQVNLGWVTQIYNAAEALPNLLNPFWMLPLLGLLQVKARDLVGYSVLQMILHVPLVFFLCWLFAQLIPYVPPLK